MYLGLTLKFCLRLEYWKMEMEKKKKNNYSKKCSLFCYIFLWIRITKYFFLLCKNVKTNNLKKTAQEH